MKRRKKRKQRVTNGMIAHLLFMEGVRIIHAMAANAKRNQEHPPVIDADYVDVTDQKLLQ